MQATQKLLGIVRDRRKALKKERKKIEHKKKSNNNNIFFTFTFLHRENLHFFRKHTLKNLVYIATFVLQSFRVAGY